MNSFPLISQKDKRPGQLYTAHFQSAVMKVVLQNGCHIMMEIAKRLHQPGDSRISRGMFKFGTRYHRIVGNIRHTT